MKMIKCIVIDDQKDAIELLSDHIKGRKELTLLETFTNPVKALTFLETNTADLIFIDVQMPHMNGLEFIETLRQKHGNNIPNFILTTGFSEFALPGFEQGVADYLLKPIGIKRFKIAMDRFFSRKLQSPASESLKNDYFFADVNNKKQKINFKDIAYVESAGNYVNVLGDNNLKATVYTSMNAMQEMLPTDNFMRVHKSYIISINHIHAIKGSELTIKRGEIAFNVPVGITYKSTTLKRLKIKD
jgi:two-component system LytT family response regulator